MRKLRGSKVSGKLSYWDIPPEYECARHWRRWSEMQREINAAVKQFWEKRKKRAYSYKRDFKFGKNVFGKNTLQTV